MGEIPLLHGSKLCAKLVRSHYCPAQNMFSCEQAFKNSVWNYDDIKAYEDQEMKKLHPVIQKWLSRNNSQKLDAEVRLWIYLATKPIWDPTGAPCHNVESWYKRILMPADLATATPYNCIFLRFFDLSPLFPFRDFHTAESFDLFCRVRLH